MAEVVSNPKTVPEIMARIKDLRRQSHQSEAELARIKAELGLRFAQLKEQVPGSWLAKLKRLGYSSRVVSRLMKIATTLTGPDGTVPPHLLERLPGDAVKLEAICSLPTLEQIEEIITQNDCRQLDRNEVAALVREKQGKKTEQTSLGPIAAIRQGWAKAIESLLKKVGEIEVPAEREQVIVFLEDTLDDLKDSLRGGEGDADQEDDEPTDEEGELTDQEAGEPTDQENDQGDDAQQGDDTDKDDEKAAEEEDVPAATKPAPAKPPMKIVGSTRKQPQPG